MAITPLIFIHSTWEIAETERWTALMYIMVSQAQCLNFSDLQAMVLALEYYRYSSCKSCGKLVKFLNFFIYKMFFFCVVCYL